MKTEDCKFRYPDSGRGSEFLARSINGAARCLCITFLLNLVCIVFAAPFGYAQAPVVVALAAIALGIAFSRRLTAKRNDFKVAKFFAVLHLAVIMLLIHFGLGYFGLAMNARFNAMVQHADRVVVRDGGGGCCSIDDDPVLYEITNKAEIARFNEMFRFSERQMQCRCGGFPGVDWWLDGKRIAVSAMHHGRAFRMQHEGYDWRLTADSRRRIGKWLKDNCRIDPNEPGPMHLMCRSRRVALAMVAQELAKSHNGAKPTIEELREEAVKYIRPRRVPSCPSGGEYSLIVDEDGLLDVVCSAPGHK